MPAAFGSLVSLLLGVALPAAPLAVAAERPNIVVFIADDASADFGAYGNTRIKTPNVDRLAREGMLFERAFLTSPQCSPSRSSMLAGRFAHTIGTEDLHVGIDKDTDLLPRHLQKAGYFTAFLLKSHFGKLGEAQFDWTDKGYYPDYVQGRWNGKARENFGTALDKAAAAQKPFFAWVGFVDPHRPYDDVANKAPRVHAPERLEVPPFLANTPATRRDLADYYDEIARLDDHIGQMLAELEKRGVLDDTIVVFLSDNGMPFPRAKGTLYDSGIRTPLIVRWPGKVAAQTRNKTLVSTIDLGATLLDLLGQPVPADWYGKSFKHQLLGQPGEDRRYVFSERNWHNTDEHARCVRTQKHKLIVNAYTELPHGTPGDVMGSPAFRDLQALKKRGKLSPAQRQIFEAPRAAVELYDVEADPHELRNLADDPAAKAVLKALLEPLESWMKETRDVPPWKRRHGDDHDRVTGAPLPSLWDQAYEMD